MNNREKAEIYLKLYEIQISRFHKRIDLEWKLFISILTAIVVATGYLAPKVEISPVSMWIIFVIGLIILLFSIRGFWKADEKDKRWSIVYRSHAEKLVGRKIDIKEFKDPIFKDFLIDGTVILRLIVFGSLLLVSLLVINKI